MTQIEFNYLVSSEYEPLRLFALKLTRKMDDANDLVQDTMLKAFRNREKFAAGTNIKGWLHT
ncbi:MAG: RNA polymerase sigma factor, partial [Bacteroidia bacterium]|nr:RNA polymerase sigma factor [Bacteroidia bacterium]NNM15314.1 RNA polymerase sigma factor [Bacteroidia bacterium]